MQLSEFALDKIIILYVLDSIEIPLSMDTLTDICYGNNWVEYMDFKQCVYDLIESNFIVNISKNATKLYVLSSDGKDCLRHFFTEIPLSKRDAIKTHIRENRANYRRKQDYFSDYYRNDDGSFTVVMRINTPSQPLMDLKLCVQSKATAKWLYKSWINKAPIIYEMLNQYLVE